MAKIDNKGQALIEYVMLLGIVVFIYVAMIDRLSNLPAFENFRKPFTQDFARTYRLGHPKAKSQEDGGPLYVPQEHTDENFRIFINPPIK